MSDNLDAEVLRFVPNHYFESAFRALKKVKQAEAEAIKQQIREWADRVDKMCGRCFGRGYITKGSSTAGITCTARLFHDLAAEMRQRAGDDNA